MDPVGRGTRRAGWLRTPRSLRLAGAAVAIAVMALLAGGCGSSKSTPPSSSATLSRAAFVSSAAPGYKVGMTVRESLPSVGELTMTADGTFSPGAHAGALTMQMHLPAAAGAGLGNLALQMVFTRGTLYMKLPASVAAKLPAAKPWLSIDLDQVGKVAGVPGLGSLVNSTSSLNSPGRYLNFLRATSVGTVENLGQATINGIETTHYHAKVSLAKLPSTVPPSDRASVRQLVAVLQSRGAVSELPIDAWIDSSHLIRRIAMSYTQPIAGQSATVQLTQDFRSYGPQTVPVPPSASETTNLLSLIKRLP